VEDAIVFLTVFAVTLALTPLLKQRAAGWHLVDLPSTRKHHSGAVPLVGGLAMGTAFLIVYAATRPAGETTTFFGLTAGIVLTLVGGALDDRRELRASLKFSFQIFAALIIATYGGALLTHFGELMSPNVCTLGRWSLPLTVVCIVGVMNAINMSDGLDGLAGSLVLAACIGFGYAAGAGGDAKMFTMICLAAGATVAFLVYNARSPWGRPATVFMGDAGSLLLGLLVAWFSIRLAMSERPSLAPMTAVWILALPLADMGTIMVRRMLRGRNPFFADREHIHHILLAMGLSHQRTTAVLFGAALALAVAGIAAEKAGVPSYFMFYGYLAVLVIYGITAEVLCRRLNLRRPQDALVATGDLLEQPAPPR
jgi:UDP-GlcNAc:undecaprenyl-phosphate GlcNAc-1-phosphate transferase